MALKSYHRETLNDNWFEERAEPLNGVLPNDGLKGYATTSLTDFNGAKALESKPRARMVNERSLGQALLQSAGADISRGFRSSLPRPDLDREKRYLETTHQAAFGTPSPLSKQPAFMHPPAGGVGGQVGERGKSTSGTAGEVYKSNQEPQRDTASQRSWLYSTDPMLVAVRRRSEGMDQRTAPGEGAKQGNNVKPDHFRRQSTSITTLPLNHKGVFIDD